VLVDVVACRAMGVEPRRIPMIVEALGNSALLGNTLDDIDEILDGPAPERRFRPPRSWPSLQRAYRA